MATIPCPGIEMCASRPAMKTLTVPSALNVSMSTAGDAELSVLPFAREPASAGSLVIGVASPLTTEDADRLSRLGLARSAPGRWRGPNCPAFCPAQSASLHDP
jgi:hypothetical protein